jgi:Flp pilus assembly secretin CpaC
MRRPTLLFAVALTLLATASGAAAPTLAVAIDQSTPINLPAGTRDVMIGNPLIANVNVVDQGKAVILGVGYGVTNLVVIDQLGRTVMERQIVVSAPTANRVSMIRGSRVEDYACATGCERSVGAAPATAPTATPVP